MLAALLNIPRNEEELLEWSFRHQDQHVKINNAIWQQQGIALPLYPLDPMPPLKSDKIGAWTYQHQSAHTSFDGLLNLPGNDFTSVDFTQEDQINSWIRLHFQDHYLAQAALGFSD